MHLGGRTWIYANWSFFEQQNEQKRKLHKIASTKKSFFPSFFKFWNNIYFAFKQNKSNVALPERNKKQKCKITWKITSDQFGVRNIRSTALLTIFTRVLKFQNPVKKF